MREILFEGKRTNNNEWICGSLKHTKIKDFDYYEIITLDNLQSATVKPETIRQFTGLLADNNKKIFEGDIMQLCSACYPCLVYWDGKSWAWKQNGKRREIDLTREKMDIIGNIYDNPEFLGE